MNQPYYTNVNSSTRVTGTFYHGLKERPIPERLFIEKFDARVIPNTIRRTVNDGSVDVIRIEEVEAVQITLTKEYYIHLCNIVNDYYVDKLVRDGNTEAYNLYMRYKTYIELLK